MSTTIGELVGYIRADNSNFERGLNASQRQMEGFTRDAEGRLRRLDGTFASVAERAAMGFDGAERGSRRFGVSLSAVTGAVGGLGGVLGNVGKIAAMFGAAAPAAAGLAATVGAIAPAAGVAATGLVAVQLATQTLKLGMKGVGDAVSAAMDPSNPQAFAEAIKNLAPSAQSFAKEIRTLQPQFKALQQSVQQRMFQGLDGVLKQMGTSTLPILKTGMTNTAGALNLMAHGVGNAAIGLSKSGTLGKAISGANTGLYNLAGAPSIFLTALTQVAAAAAPAFGRITAGAGGALERFSERFSQSFASGGMEKAIDQAIAVLGQLGQIAGNVGSIVGSIFTTAQASGGGFLGTLQQITGSLATAFASPAVQSGMKAIFETMATLASTIGPLLTQALTALAPVFTALGPPIQRLIETLGTALGPVIEQLGPVMVVAAEAVGQLLDAVSPLIPVFGDLLAQILPALTPILKTIGDVFAQMAPIVGQLAGVLMSALAPILAALVPVLEPILAAFMTLVQAILPIITQQITAFAPIIAQLAGIFAQLMVALAPVIAQLITLVASVLTRMMPVITPIIEILAKFASILADELGAAINNIVIPAFNLIMNLLSGDFAGAWESVKQLVSGVIETFLRIFRDLPARAGAALAGLASAVWGKVSEAGSRMLGSIREKVGEVVGFIKTVPGKAKDALGNLGSLLWNSGQSLIRGFIDGIKSMIGNVKDGARSVVNAARNFFPFSPAKEGPFAGKGWTLYSGQALGEGFAEGIGGTKGLVGRSIDMMLRSAQGAVSGLGTSAAQAGLGMALPSAGSGAAGAASTLPVEVTVRLDGPESMTKLIRDITAVVGRGNVQTAFGS
ncbi:hypothetical protein ACFV0B_06740 [Streptomyces xanthophaeus]|uniref:phage tail protein n=1 Tax=Streptomyces xanthophaeus TaxID=67385 RepID=UPI0036765AF9